MGNNIEITLAEILLVLIFFSSCSTCQYTSNTDAELKKQNKLLQEIKNDFSTKSKD